MITFGYKIKTLVLAGFILSFFIFIFAAKSAQADGYGLDTTAGAAGLRDDRPITELIGTVIGAGLSMIGVLFFILMVYGGFLWMTAHGNEDQSKKAFQTIIAATIGILIVVAAYAITNFVFTKVAQVPTAPTVPAAGLS